MKKCRGITALFFVFTTMTIMIGCSEKDDSGSDSNEILIAYYPLDGNAEDASGHDSHGTVSGAVSAPDRHDAAGKAMSFDGLSTYISVNDTTNFQFTDYLTIASWVRTDSQKSQIVFRKGGSLVIPVFELYLSKVGSRGFRIGSQSIEKTGGYPLNTWMHLAGTYDGESMIFYIDGVPIDTLSAPGALTSDKNLLMIGTRTGLNADTFAGRLDEIRIYHKVLSASEIAQLAAE